ncbi:hypothetical protein T484DRAFT_1945453 [Baffinella frigidus]|nr:hypothetical protein T484DRAFT_1945453 [Cryptophyta sp. CCMP2293]
MLVTRVPRSGGSNRNPRAPLGSLTEKDPYSSRQQISPQILPPPSHPPMALSNPALWAAVSAGQTEDALRLLDDGADVKETNWAGVSALHYAAEKGNHVLVAVLVEKGADVNLQTFEGSFTPLHDAAQADWQKLGKSAPSLDSSETRMLPRASAGTQLVRSWKDGLWCAILPLFNSMAISPAPACVV